MRDMIMKTYKNIETWTKAMKKDKQKKLWADWFTIGGHDYVCEEYDSSGKYMRYTSITAYKHLDIETSNRYSPAWLSDMVATEYSIADIGLRFDVSYYIDDITKLKSKDILKIADNLYTNKLHQNGKQLLELIVKN